MIAVPFAQLSAGLFLGLTVWAAAPASAQSPAGGSESQAESAAVPTLDDDDREARQLFLSGQRAFVEGRFEDALFNFKQSYSLSGRPALLYNIGAAQDRLRRSRDALDSFEQYLDLAPDADNAREVRARVELLRTELEQEATQVSVAEPVDSDATTARRLRRAGLALLGVTAVAGGLGLYFYLDARGTHEDLEAACGPFSCTQEQVDASHGPRRQRAARALLGVTLAAAAASVTLMVIGSSKSRTVALDVGFGSILVRGRF